MTSKQSVAPRFGIRRVRNNEDPFDTYIQNETIRQKSLLQYDRQLVEAEPLHEREPPTPPLRIHTSTPTTVTTSTGQTIRAKRIHYVGNSARPQNEKKMQADMDLLQEEPEEPNDLDTFPTTNGEGGSAACAQWVYNTDDDTLFKTRKLVEASFNVCQREIKSLRRELVALRVRCESALDQQQTSAPAQIASRLGRLEHDFSTVQATSNEMTNSVGRILRQTRAVTGILESKHVCIYIPDAEMQQPVETPSGAIHLPLLTQTSFMPSSSAAPPGAAPPPAPNGRSANGVRSDVAMTLTVPRWEMPDVFDFYVRSLFPEKFCVLHANAEKGNITILSYSSNQAFVLNAGTMVVEIVCFARSRVPAKIKMPEKKKISPKAVIVLPPNNHQVH